MLSPQISRDTSHEAGHSSAWLTAHCPRRHRSFEKTFSGGIYVRPPLHLSWRLFCISGSCTDGVYLHAQVARAGNRVRHIKRDRY